MKTIDGCPYIPLYPTNITYPNIHDILLREWWKNTQRVSWCLVKCTTDLLTR